MKNLKINALAILAILAISSCSKDEPAKQPAPVVEEELFTTITAVFTPIGTGNIVTLRSRDVDGDGPIRPDITISGPFAQNTTYNGEVTALDETKSPAKDMTEEIQELGAEHQLFYVKTGNLPNFTYTPIAESADNFDANGKPIGLKTKFVTTSAATGSLKIILKHEGNKSAAGVVNGDFTNATGSTDFEVTFIGINIQ